MIETTQILLIIVILTLTGVLTLVGIQVFLILREVQTSIRKMNLLLDEARKAAQAASDSLTGLAGGLGGLRAVFKLLNLFKRKPEEKNE